MADLFYTLILRYSYCMYQYCYLNGKVTLSSKASVPINDIGILRGFGVFDFIKIYNGVPFRLDEHIDRLERSAKLLGLKLPYSKKHIIEITRNLIKKNKANTGCVRIILTGGETIGGISFDSKKPTFAILIEDVKDLPPSLFKKGAKLITYEHMRPFFSAKTTNYVQSVLLQKKKQQAGAIDILYVHNGKVLEPSTSNIFMFKRDALITTKDNVLIGITRNAVLDVARDHFKIKEKDFRISELLSADEVFITASNKEILPIVKIDGSLISNGRVGGKTKKLMESFDEVIAKETSL